MDAFEAALTAGTTRLRPVLMTAAAMVVGMVPMAIGGPGEEQNAVLARAVIGGVLVGTLTTLLFVPYLYSIFGRFERQAKPAQDEKLARQEHGQLRHQGSPS
jgi:multidrug efflux pump subunit AcrB